MKRIILALLAAAICFVFAGCDNSALTAKTNVLETEPDAVVPAGELKAGGSSHKTGFQVELPEKGEEIAVVTTNLGSFKMRFFPQEAPKAVYNFKKLSQQGYYNGVTFHRVVDGFMIQGGDPEGTGRGGQSVWGEKFEDEFSDKLCNITGAVSMANAGPNTNGSQFFINNNPSEPQWEYFAQLYDLYYEENKELINAQGGTLIPSKVTSEMRQLYREYGGNVNLDGVLNTAGRGHTVFAQVFEGMETVNAISAVATDENDKPLEDVVIESVEIVLY